MLRHMLNYTPRPLRVVLNVKLFSVLFSQLTWPPCLEEGNVVVVLQAPEPTVCHILVRHVVRTVRKDSVL